MFCGDWLTFPSNAPLGGGVSLPDFPTAAYIDNRLTNTLTAKYWKYSGHMIEQYSVMTVMHENRHIYKYT